MDRTEPVTGPEHAAEALRLGKLANARYWDRTDRWADNPNAIPGGSRYEPTEDERYRMLVTAHLHASLARTAALLNAAEVRPGSTWIRQAWNKVFDR
ncbi:hypothetical protein [Polymorphospora lycopeni]|uniref:Uncharacterized protein n=1 Tax=Polymorphospora lycopeni TaxID=3140240 RepID=A0ABV5CL01_9ACTN